MSSETTSPAYIEDAGYFRPYVAAADQHLFVFRVRADGVPGVVEVTETADLSRTDWTVHGFAITGQFDREGFDGQLSVSVEEVLDRTPLCEGDFPVSFFKVIAVDPTKRSRGIGTELGAKAVAPLFAAPPALVVAWVRENPANRRLVEQYAHSRVARFESYFGPEWDCPECGFEATCTCDVELYAYFGDERDQAVYAANTGVEAE
jgi:ribosomal protein S18 acetylase RimI-like enzyme